MHARSSRPCKIHLPFVCVSSTESKARLALPLPMRGEHFNKRGGEPYDAANARTRSLERLSQNSRCSERRDSPTLRRGRSEKLRPDEKLLYLQNMESKRLLRQKRRESYPVNDFGRGQR